MHLPPHALARWMSDCLAEIGVSVIVYVFRQQTESNGTTLWDGMKPEVVRAV